MLTYNDILRLFLTFVSRGFNHICDDGESGLRLTRVRLCPVRWSGSLTLYVSHYCMCALMCALHDTTYSRSRRHICDI